MDMQLSCKDAMEKLGLDFGAFDVLYSPYLDNRYAIIEVNTAPSLSPLALEKYLEYFKKEMVDDAEYI
jgi:glutathione synthase/RimK-type ligase-like ATP-grasp enzyme